MNGKNKYGAIIISKQVSAFDSRLANLVDRTTDLSSQVDAFAFDSTVPNSELVAIDDVVWPKYAFTYNVSQDVPKVGFDTRFSFVHENLHLFTERGKI